MPAVLWDIALLIVGLAVIFVGGRLLILGASSVALRLGVKPILVGVTILAFGTSAPEFFLALLSSTQGAAPVSVGNVLGANVNDMTIVLGLGAVILPLATNFREVRLEMYATLSALLLFGLLALDGGFDRVDGLIFISLFIVILYKIITKDRIPSSRAQTNDPDQGLGWRRSWSFLILLLVLGVTALAFGSDLAISSSVDLARSLGVSELIIGATIISLGTTLPEITVSVISAYKGEPDLAVGNALGSVFFNTLMVTGAVAVISGVFFETSIVIVSVVFLIAVVLLVMAIMRWRPRISRLSGAVLICLYVVFIVMILSLY